MVFNILIKGFYKKTYNFLSKKQRISFEVLNSFF